MESSGQLIWNGLSAYPVAFTKEMGHEQLDPYYETIFLQHKSKNEFKGKGMVRIDLKNIRTDGTISLHWFDEKKIFEELISFTIEIVHRQTSRTIGSNGQETETPWETLAIFRWQKLTQEVFNQLPIIFQLTDEHRAVLTRLNPTFIGAFQLYFDSTNQ
jgi:hypothetical protein